MCILVCQLSNEVVTYPLSAGIGCSPSLAQSSWWTVIGNGWMDGLSKCKLKTILNGHSASVRVCVSMCVNLSVGPRVQCSHSSSRGLPLLKELLCPHSAGMPDQLHVFGKLWAKSQRNHWAVEYCWNITFQVPCSPCFTHHSGNVTFTLTAVLHAIYF